MKKWMRMTLCLTMLLGLLCGCGKASYKETPAEEFSYDIVDGTVVITGYHGTEREIVIPEMIDDRPVTIIGSRAFEGYDMTSIVIPKNVWKIERLAISCCACLEKVEFLCEGCAFEEYAFHMCDSLKKIEMPEESCAFSPGTFSSCEQLEEIVLSDKINIISVGSGYADEILSDCDNARFIIGKKSVMYETVKTALDKGEDLPVKIK